MSTEEFTNKHGQPPFRRDRSVSAVDIAGAFTFCHPEHNPILHDIIAANRWKRAVRTYEKRTGKQAKGTVVLVEIVDLEKATEDKFVE